MSSKSQKTRIPLAEVLAGVLEKGKFWTDAWSLIEGCTPISPGCRGCWLAGMHRRNLPNMTSGLTGNSGQFNGKVVCRKDRLNIPLKRKKTTVYAIWSDLFHESVTDEFRDDAFGVMWEAQQHYFIIVTKRPEVAAKYLQNREWSDAANRITDRYIRPLEGPLHNMGEADGPFSNVIILVTMEDQDHLDKRLPHALKLSARGWNVGALHEPLLSEIIYPSFGHLGESINAMKWIITGGESGRNARPAHPDWVRKLRDQANAAQIPFAFKQWGEWLPGEQTSDSGTCYRRCDNGEIYAATGCQRQNFGTHPDLHSGHLITCRVGKKAAGRLLDGKEHMEVPNV